MPTFFKMIYDTARGIKPDSMVEFCPCRTGYSFFTLPTMNMIVKDWAEGATPSTPLEFHPFGEIFA